MQKIIPHLWYDKEALEAANWYVSLFENSKIINVTTLSDTPSGDAEMVDFEIANLKFSAISAGPYFKFNPSISLMVTCSTIEEVDRLHANLSTDGIDLMPLQEYPFSKRYAWVQDKYGLSWQLMFVEAVEEQKIRVSFLFSGNECGSAESAINFYTSVFKDSKKGFINYYKAGEAMDPRANINYSELDILGNQFIVMDHGYGGDFTFNEAFSIVILCDDQDEIDYYWDKLSFVPEAEECGWIKDKFGVSWQIIPSNMNDILFNGTQEEIERVTDAFLQMKKFDIKALEKVRLGQ